MTRIDFDYCIGNPPYQLDVQGEGKKRTSVDIFPDFQKTVSSLAKNTIMIYPATNPLFSSDEDLPAGPPYRGLDLDHRLYKYFQLSPDEIALFENGDKDANT